MRGSSLLRRTHKILDHFGHEGQAKGYAEFRPTYPPALLQSISDYCGRGQRDLAVDVATGTGQVAVPLATAPPGGLGFQRVLAFDRSQAQLAQAAPHARVEYVSGDCYQMPSETHRADLVTVGQAAHWFDMPRFLAECARVLRPGGVVAVLGYGMCSLRHAPAQAALRTYYAALGSHLPLGAPGNYWDCDRVLLDAGLAAVAFSPPLADVRREWHHVDRTLAPAGLRGYLRTMSAYRTYCLQHPDRPDLVDTAMASIAALLGPQAPIDITIPFFLILGRSVRSGGEG